MPIAWMIIIIGDGGDCDSGIGGEAHLQQNSNADACPAVRGRRRASEDDDTALIATQLKIRSPIKFKLKTLVFRRLM